MCGICGIYRRDGAVDGELLLRMRETLVHRGPDAAGLHVDPQGRAGLAHRRLSIIDLSEAGTQPLSNEDGSIWVAFNGEIYNFEELREDLVRRGHRFASRTDTEVLVHLYEEAGDDFLRLIDGQFAISLWDAPRRRLLLARDHFGKKPLYYRETAEGLAFASEIKALLADPACAREIDPGSVADYLTFQYVPQPRTIFRGISKLPPGHALVAEDGGVRVLPFWDLAVPPAEDGEPGEVPAARIRELLAEAVRRRLVADVPLGVFLSGGVDSSAIVATMASLGVERIRTFSVGFDDPHYDESRFARMVAERYGTEHHELPLEPASALELIPSIARQFDEPLADQAAVPTYLMCRAAREHVTVCLAGEGGDEVFGGYGRYALALQQESHLDSLARGERRLRRLLTPPLAPQPAAYVETLCSFDDKQRQQLLARDFLHESRRGRSSPWPHLDEQWRRADHLDYFTRLQRVDIATYLTDNLLVKVDRASMLASLEVRAPMLDRDLVRFGLGLHRSHKAVGPLGKIALKQALREMLPAEVLWRPKMGFSMPLAKWFTGDLQGYVRESVLDGADEAVFHRPALEQLVGGDWMARPDAALKVWTVLMYHEWRRAWL